MHSRLAHTFLLFLMVTREMLGTGFMPSFCIALRLFFSDLLCLLREDVPSSAKTISGFGGIQ